MTGSTRIKGNKLALSFGGTEFWADHTKYELDNEEASSDVTTFADAAEGGGRTFFLALGAIQSTDDTSFWRYAWENTGEIVAYRLAPHGNAVASVAQPHFTGTVKIGPKPKIGGEADPDGEFDFEIRWDCQEEPTLDVGTDGEPSITSISPAGQTVGEPVMISGERFTGVTAVAFGATPVAAGGIVFVSSQTLVVTIPAGTGVKAVKVTTPEGDSPTVNYTVAAS